jgi:DNA-binding XRE family transcriptional regulator
MSKNLVEVLMERDGMSREEAAELVNITREEVFAAMESGDCDPEDIIANNLGLEVDYIFEIIG